MKLGYYGSSMIWNFVSKFTNAGVQFLLVKVLLSQLGEKGYGVIALMLSLNGISFFMDMGMNVTSVKFFSEYISKNLKDVLGDVVLTTFVFYLGIGLANFVLVVVAGFYSGSIFSLDSEHSRTVLQCCILLGIFSLVNWPLLVFNQLLVSYEKVMYLYRFELVRSILLLFLLAILYVVRLKLELFYALYLAVYLVPLFLALGFVTIRMGFRIKSYKLDLVRFREMFRYSASVFSMSVFQFVANKGRPIVLGIVAVDSLLVVGEYRILETIVLFVISLGATSKNIFLPKASKLNIEDRVGTQKFVESGTLLTSVVSVMLCGPLILCAKEILFIYVGNNYVDLSAALQCWLFAVILFIHNGPVVSLLLAYGKMKGIVINTACASVMSIMLLFLTGERYGVFASVLGYLLYVLIQMAFYYGYVNSKVLGIHSGRLFLVFFKVFCCGFLSLGICFCLGTFDIYLYAMIAIKIFTFFALFSILMYLFNRKQLSAVIGGSVVGL